MNHADKPDNSSLASRIEKLERENRLHKRLAIISALVASAMLVMGQAPATRRIVADEFVLNDSAGTVRATLGFVRNEPTLTLIDANGRVRTSLGTEAIGFKDTNSTTRVLLGSSTAASLELVEGKAQVIDQGPGLMFSYADKRAAMYLTGKSQGPSIILFDPSQSSSNSRAQAALAFSPDGPSLELSDAQGFRTIVGSASLRTPSTGASSRTSAASVILFDKDGQSIWSAP